MTLNGFVSMHVFINYSDSLTSVSQTKLLAILPHDAKRNIHAKLRRLLASAGANRHRQFPIGRVCGRLVIFCAQSVAAVVRLRVEGESPGQNPYLQAWGCPPGRVPKCRVRAFRIESPVRSEDTHLCPPAHQGQRLAPLALWSRLRGLGGPSAIGTVPDSS